MREPLTIRGIVRLIFHDARTGRELRRVEAENLITNSGAAVIAQLLNGEIQVVAPIYGAVGTASTAPAVTDTQLGSELARALVASQARGGNLLTWNFFFTTAMANGSIAEAGVFLSALGLVASPTANSGALLNHALVSASKNNTETMTLQVQLTINTG